MTSNQIANAANVETHRHNTVTEELSAQSLENDRERNRIQKEYNDKVTDIQERYNAVSLALQEAQGNRKLDLQQQLNWIELEKYNADLAYKQSMVDINAKDADTRARSQLETERYQKSLTDLGFAKNEIDAQVANLKARQLEYDKYFRDQEVRIQDLNALVNKRKVDNDYSLGLIRAELEETRNELQATQQEWEQATMFTDSVWKGVQTIGSLLIGGRR